MAKRKKGIEQRLLDYLWKEFGANEIAYSLDDIYEAFKDEEGCTMEKVVNAYVEMESYVSEYLSSLQDAIDSGSEIKL